METALSQSLIDKLAAAYMAQNEPPAAPSQGNSSCLLNDRRPDARWNVSGAFTQDRILMSLREFLVQKFQLEGIHQVSGAPACAWTGGRSRSQQVRPPAILDAIRRYDAMGLSVNLVFSNVLVGKQHLGDTLANYAVDALDGCNRTGNNGIILGSDLLAEHLREKHPGLKRIAAVARLAAAEDGQRPELYRSLLGLYDRIIIHPDDNFDLDRLAALEDKDRYEIVVNEPCILHCPRRQEHYELVSAQFHDFLNIDLEAKELELVRRIGCGHDLRKLLLSPESRSVTLSTQECQRLYDLGFRHFKIQGRNIKSENALLYQILRWILNDTPQTDAISSRLIMRMFGA